AKLSKLSRHKSSIYEPYKPPFKSPNSIALSRPQKQQSNSIAPLKPQYQPPN
ncbi:22867_t:CDS:1, partial [Gigaspora rosea]